MTAEEQVRGVLLAAARASAPRWPPGLLERVLEAIDSADPPGWNPTANRRQWGEAIAEKLAGVPQNAGERALLEKLQATADGAASGFEFEAGGVLAPVLEQGAAVGAAGQEAIEGIDKSLRSPVAWLAAAAIAAGGAYLYTRRRR